MISFFLRLMITVSYLKYHVFTVLCLIMLVSSPSAFAALEKSSKKECAICHVMWLDEFRTETETLIEWQPGNVLMKDTQGIVSSEDICYSCHDGYVLDSRHIAWKGHNHTTFKKPSENVKIPDVFTLSNRDEIYCGTCHTPHSVQASESVSETGEAISGPNSFLRLPNSDSAMCEACHVNSADYKRTFGHPLHTDKQKIPEKLFELGGKQAEKKDSVICQTCHLVHGAPSSNLTIMDNRKSELCMVCHEQRTVIGTQHDPSQTMPGTTNMKGQPISESGPCGACHVPHNSAGYRLWARTIVPGNPASVICLSCHTETPDDDLNNQRNGEVHDKIKGIGRYSHPNNVNGVSEPDSLKAFQRIRSNVTDNLPFFDENGNKQPGGTVQCFSCHNIHQWNPAFQEKRGGKDVEGDASNSFLRISASRTSALCVECHRDKRQILSYDHNLVVTAPEAINIQGVTSGISGPCGACHIPHNAADKNLWARKLSEDNETIPLQYCTECHTENGPAKEKKVGENDHLVNAVSGGMHIPPSAKVTTMLPLYNANGTEENGDRIVCRTCHDPHAWSPVDGGTGASADTKAGLSAGAGGAAAENIEGDARTSFLRKVASPSPDLCVVCHEHSALLVGTDHDLFVTAPAAKNRMEQTVEESGQCGMCHAVHNSPEKRLLWAASYGPVAENQHPMNGACTGCHSEGGIAENKIPPAAAHPEGQLITNIMMSDTQAGDYIKIFDNDWHEVQVGDLSCSSCHSYFLWDHRNKKQGPGINVEGDADTSFLRTMSERAVCIECHGETAIWRYTYFHSLEKREMLKTRQP